jgi:hypothetical protein
MIHLVGLVFSGGLGIPLYINESMFQDIPVELIWSVSSAIQTFVADSLGDIHGKRTSSDLKSGNIRLINYDPFVDLTEIPKVDLYTLMALQDRYDNIELTREKLREIHNIILPFGLDRPNASVRFYVPQEEKRRIQKIVLRTQELSQNSLIEIKNAVDFGFKLLEENGFIPLKISIADIDNGLIYSKNGRDLVEDPAFTELILSNIVAENPADSKSVMIERDAPLWVNLPFAKEVFTMDHIGENTDFRLLTRVCFSNEEPSMRFSLVSTLQKLAENMDGVIQHRI